MKPTTSPSSTNCGEKYCIKKDDDNELIREINIRLAGFGGNVPTTLFTDRTEKMIKQFQRDYMKVPETGKVCGKTLRAIDEFCNAYKFTFDQIKCKCSTKGKSTKDVLLGKNVTNKCDGFGDGSNKNIYVKHGSTEKHHAYEHPGLHRCLLHALKTVMFYMDKINPKYKYHSISSGFRCRFHSIFVGSQTTNHMGKSLDVLFDYEKGGRAQKKDDLDTIRKNYFEKYLNATYWTGNHNFGLETYAQGAKTWVHFDVREFDSQYLEDKYFVKTVANLNGKSILTLAFELGYKVTCSCTGNGKSQATKAENSTDKDDRVDPKTLKTSQKGIDFIKDWEKFRPNLYNDDAKGHHCTIGYGHLVHRGSCDGSESEEFKKGITEARALELFKSRLTEFEQAIQRDISVNLYQYEFDALVSLVFNTGSEFLNTGGAKGGETQIKKKINTKEYPEGADEMSDVTNGGLSGLVKRRKAEIQIFKENLYDSTH